MEPRKAGPVWVSKPGLIRREHKLFPQRGAHPERRDACRAVRPPRTPGTLAVSWGGNTHTHGNRPPSAPPRIHVRAVCGAHGRAEGARRYSWRVARLTSPVRGQLRDAGGSCVRRSPSFGRRAAQPVVSLILQHFFFFFFPRCKFSKLLTKLFGLHHIRPNESYSRGQLRGPFVLQSVLPLCSPQPKGFYCISHISHAPKCRKWERSPSQAITPHYFVCTRLRLQVRGDAREGARYQSRPGKSKQAASAAPLSINAFTPSKSFQCK